jgi:hypothetical protein
MLNSCGKSEENDDSCNGESVRRDIKIAVDEAAFEIDTIPIITTIDSLSELDVPKAKKDLERQEVEKHVYTITGKVDKVKKYRDGDYHIKLVNENEVYMNCEAPNLGCSFAKASIFYDKYEKVRAFINEHKDDLEGKTVTITGVGFIDLDHKYPRNSAPNEIELHPMLDIHF